MAFRGKEQEVILLITIMLNAIMNHNGNQQPYGDQVFGHNGYNSRGGLWRDGELGGSKFQLRDSQKQNIPR